MISLLQKCHMIQLSLRLLAKFTLLIIPRNPYKEKRSKPTKQNMSVWVWISQWLAALPERLSRCQEFCRACHCVFAKTWGLFWGNIKISLISEYKPNRAGFREQNSHSFSMRLFSDDICCCRKHKSVISVLSRKSNLFIKSKTQKRDVPVRVACVLQKWESHQKRVHSYETSNKIFVYIYMNILE